MKVKKVLVSQPKPSSEKSPYYEIAEKYGIQIDFRPFIKVEGLSAKEFRQSRINITDFTAIIFTARTAIDHFFRLCEEMRVNIPDTMKYFCTTESIALYLQKYIIYRKRKIFHGSTGKLDGLLPLLVKHNKEKYLYVVSDVHKDDTAALDSNKINYTKAVMYRTVGNVFPADPLTTTCSYSSVLRVSTRCSKTSPNLSRTISRSAASAPQLPKPSRKPVCDSTSKPHRLKHRR